MVTTLSRIPFVCAGITVILLLFYVSISSGIWFINAMQYVNMWSICCYPLRARFSSAAQKHWLIDMEPLPFTFILMAVFSLLLLLSSDIPIVTLSRLKLWRSFESLPIYHFVFQIDWLDCKTEFKVRRLNALSKEFIKKFKLFSNGNSPRLLFNYGFSYLFSYLLQIKIL